MVYMANYYRKPNKDNYEDDIKNLNNKIDIQVLRIWHFSRF